MGWGYKPGVINETNWLMKVVKYNTKYIRFYRYLFSFLNDKIM